MSLPRDPVDVAKAALVEVYSVARLNMRDLSLVRITAAIGSHSRVLRWARDAAQVSGVEMHYKTTRRAKHCSTWYVNHVHDHVATSPLSSGYTVISEPFYSSLCFFCFNDNIPHSFLSFFSA